MHIEKNLGTSRSLLHTVDAQPAQDGDGVQIHRLGGPTLQRAFDPFLLLDEINSADAADYIDGFPPHPHRGFETITYMKEGRMRHRDHLGNEGVIGPGGVQWMRAGRGVVHAEMPEQAEGRLHGFQIWLNLPAADKLSPANYRELTAAQMAHAKLQAGMVRVIAGELRVAGQTLVSGFTRDDPRRTAPLLADVELGADQQLTLEFAADQPAFVYVYRGQVNELQPRQFGIYATGQTLSVKAHESDAGLLILSGRALAEPIVQHGPFVMNSEAEIAQAMADYQRGVLTEPGG